jgi:penicillin G amidase
LQVRTIDEALKLTPQCGLPQQNFVCADRSGRIAWSIIGMIPRRIGPGKRGAIAAREAGRWDGFLPPDEYPRLLDPACGCLWTANNRVVGGAAFAKIGNAGMDTGLRAGQIRDRLLALDQATEADMLKVQLDDEARSYRKWQQLFLNEVPYVAANPRRYELRRLVETWDGHASAESAGYRIVNAFRFEVRRLILEPIREEINRKGVFGPSSPTVLPQDEGILWALVTARPLHVLSPRYASWPELFQTAADNVTRLLQAEGRPFEQCAWGLANATLVKHPLSDAVPLLGRWLDLPPAALPGARMDLPRITSPGHGASQRFVVSPGKEELGLFHMPGGQSGHPLSPHYHDGHADWEQGKPTPFLPGAKVHEMVLSPKR